MKIELKNNVILVNNQKAGEYTHASRYEGILHSNRFRLATRYKKDFIQMIKDNVNKPKFQL